MNKEQKYDDIERYLTNQLNDQDKSEFEEKLKLDGKFRKEVNLHKALQSNLTDQKLRKLSQALNEVDSDWVSPSDAKVIPFYKSKLFKIGSIAASFLLLMFVAQKYLLPGELSTEQIFAENFEQYTMILNQRSGTSDDYMQSELNQAINDYETKNYQDAAKTFHQISISKPENLAYAFYEGVSSLANQESTVAINIFSKIIESKEALYEEQSRWYLALAYIQGNQQSLAIEQLKEIKKGDMNFDKAQELLKHL